jgi:hypothetical protein
VAWNRGSWRATGSERADAIGIRIPVEDIVIVFSIFGG